jgi:hypothetical protein
VVSCRCASTRERRVRLVKSLREPLLGRYNTRHLRQWSDAATRRVSLSLSLSRSLSRSLLLDASSSDRRFKFEIISPAGAGPLFPLALDNWTLREIVPSSRPKLLATRTATRHFLHPGPAPPPDERTSERPGSFAFAGEDGEDGEDGWTRTASKGVVELGK